MRMHDWAGNEDRNCEVLTCRVCGQTTRACQALCPGEKTTTPLIDAVSKPVHYTARPVFPRQVWMYGPYLVRVGDVEMEFEDATCDRVLSIKLRRAGRDVEIDTTHSGTAPQEVSVRVKADNCHFWHEIYSKRDNHIEWVTRDKEDENAEG